MKTSHFGYRIWWRRNIRNFGDSLRTDAANSEKTFRWLFVAVKAAKVRDEYYLTPNHLFKDGYEYRLSRLRRVTVVYFCILRLVGVGNKPVILSTGKWVVSRAGLDGYDNSFPHQYSIPGQSSPQRVAIPTEPFRPTEHRLLLAFASFTNKTKFAISQSAVKVLSQCPIVTIYRYKDITFYSSIEGCMYTCGRHTNLGISKFHKEPTQQLLEFITQTQNIHAYILSSQNVFSNRLSYPHSYIHHEYLFV
jgi:hypothetical protein